MCYVVCIVKYNALFIDWRISGIFIVFTLFFIILFHGLKKQKLCVWTPPKMVHMLKAKLFNCCKCNSSLLYKPNYTKGAQGYLHVTFQSLSQPGFKLNTPKWIAKKSKIHEWKTQSTLATHEWQMVIWSLAFHAHLGSLSKIATQVNKIFQRTCLSSNCECMHKAAVSARVPSVTPLNFATSFIKFYSLLHWKLLYSKMDNLKKG